MHAKSPAWLSRVRALRHHCGTREKEKEKKRKKKQKHPIEGRSQTIASDSCLIALGECYTNISSWLNKTHPERLPARRCHQDHFGHSRHTAADGLSTTGVKVVGGLQDSLAHERCKSRGSHQQRTASVLRDKLAAECRDGVDGCRIQGNVPRPLFAAGMIRAKSHRI